MDIKKAKKLVFDFYDLMISEPAWSGHVFMAEYSDAITLYREVHSMIMELGRSRLEFDDLLLILEKSEKNELDGVYSVSEWGILSDQMSKFLETMVGIISTEIVLMAFSDEALSGEFIEV